MKRHWKFTAALTALLILWCSYPVFAAEIELSPEIPPEEAVAAPEILPEASQEPDMLPPSEAPAFDIDLVYSFEGYVVKGTFSEFTDDINQIHTLYSLDGESYQECGEEWRLPAPEESFQQTQICLYDTFKPLKSYLEGTIDSFYLKLCLTLKNGNTYESQTAFIDRGESQSVPEGITFSAWFAPSVGVIERNPFSCYGRYQLNVSPSATTEEISALLPDTLSVNVELHQERQLFATDTVDCPVTWKALSFPQLTAGESITIPNAAEQIMVPAGTVLHTPLGVFCLNEPLSLNQNMPSDEIRLILNVSGAENPIENPSDQNTKPEIKGGSGGNENNAGSGNKNDGTNDGQRPDLPQTPEENPEAQPLIPVQAQAEQQQTQFPEPAQTQKTQQQEQLTDSAPIQDAQQTPLPEPVQAREKQQPIQLPDSVWAQEESQFQVQPTTPARALEEPSKEQLANSRQADKIPVKTSVTEQEKAITNRTSDHQTKIPAPTVLPTEIPLSASQKELYDPDTEGGRNRIFLPMAAVPVIGICIATVTSKIRGRKKR